MSNNQIPDEFPHGYEVRLSVNGQQWSAPVAQGHGTVGITEIAFAPAPARFIRITNTRYHHKTPWSIDGVEVLLPAPPVASASE